MERFKKINNVAGWLTFLVASMVYCLTIEPTASFWDCPEFITTGYKLEVGHPPGAPFFMLVANLFSQFASDATQVARMVNYMSALMSGACIMFLFWSVTHLVRKLVVKEDSTEISLPKAITIIGSGLVGAFAYCFSDTFWFSAVEGEVYAFSSLFTAVVFWLILKWEDMVDQPGSERWLILIAYLTGLSIGVHLLNLLCLPAIVLVYYYKKTPNATAWGSILALVASAILVAAVLYGIVPGIAKVGGWFELFFVNTLGMGFNTGVIVYIIVLAAVLIWGIYESYKARNATLMNVSFLLTVALLGIPFYGHGTSAVIIGLIILAVLWFLLRPAIQQKMPEKWRVSARTLNTTLLAVMMMVLGYSSYALIMIRSTANTPMDQNSPEDIFTLGEYLGREQYGTYPLFYGKTYNSKVALDEKDGYCEPRIASQEYKWVRKEKTSPDEPDSYTQILGRTNYDYEQKMFFPRMWDSDMGHPAMYEAWMDIEGHEVPYDQCGQMIMVKIPTQWENIKFFFSYQLNWMYWRYFMWNFAGRQNDLRGNGELENGNWITGFNFIDNLLVGNQELLPTEMKENKGHNVYYCLPLLLGLFGLFWQSYRGQKGIQQFWVVFFLFFMTGIAIVVYLNQTPGQPRERDYAYAGSFYAFAIWIGMGVAAIIETLLRYAKTKPMVTAAAVSVICLLVPIQMASQNWDDHDRSGRYMTRDFGQNYLMTLPEEGHPIIYTNGDNDTFPLWYNQDVEGFRLDARICNLSYLQTDWYIDQMRRPAYDSPSLPISWERSEYVEGTNDYVEVVPSYKQSIDNLYADARKQAEEGNPQLLQSVIAEYGEDPYELENIFKYWVRGKHADLHVIPTDSIVMKIDKEAVRRSGMLIPTDSIPDHMTISLKGKRMLIRSELMMLEMLLQANWERPIFIAISVGSDNMLGMEDHFIQEGLAYRFTPFSSKETGVKIDSERMYDNLMHKFKFGGLEAPGLYIDENLSRMCMSLRRVFSLLINQLMKEGKTDKAREVLRYADEHIPTYNIPYDYQNGALDMADAWYQLEEKQEGDRIADALANKEVEYITWYLSLSDYHLTLPQDNCEYHLALLDRIVKSLKAYESPLAANYEDKLDELYEIYVGRIES